MFGGLALIVVLIVYQFRAQRPLLTVRTMLTSAIPVAGVGRRPVRRGRVGGGDGADRQCVVAGLQPGPRRTAVSAGGRRRHRHGGRVRVRHHPHGDALPAAGGHGAARGGHRGVPARASRQRAVGLIGSALTGLALGATVAPALFVAGFSLQSSSLQRVFAIIELLRAVAAFMVAPILAHFAVACGGDLTAGTGVTLWIGFGLAIGGAVFGVAIYALSGARPQQARLGRVPRRGVACVVLAAVVGASPVGRAVTGRRGRARSTDDSASGHRPTSVGPVLFAYDGTEFAASAIRTGAGQLGPGRRAGGMRVAACGRGFHAHRRTALRRRSGAEVSGQPRRTAANGASLAEKAGFRAQSAAVEAAPTWKGIVQVAEEHDASLIVLGPHRRSGLLGHLQGSVAAAVIAHSTTPVLVIPERRNGREAHVETPAAEGVSNKVAD